MSNDHFGGIVMICTGIGIFLITWLWVLLAYKKEGPAIWHRASRLGLFIAGWVASLAMRIAVIVFVTKPDAPKKHAQAMLEVRV